MLTLYSQGICGRVVYGLDIFTKSISKTTQKYGKRA